MTQIEIPDTPLMRQYKALKEKHKDSILFFRLGDFYEMFNEDARTASAFLSLTLTARQGIPMCGIPYHAAANYLSRLINGGYTVAVCEQVGEEDKKTKLFKREIVRVITPGTLIEDELLGKKSANYLVSIICDLVGWGIAYSDVSTGEFYATQKLNDPDLYHLSGMISRIDPAEAVTDTASLKYMDKAGQRPPKNMSEQFLDESPEFAWAQAAAWKNNKLALKAALLNISYIKKIQPSSALDFKPVFFEDENTMKLDETAIKTLELVSSEYEGGFSLWDVLDSAKTSMGSRMLKRWILNPLSDIHSINLRQNFVNFLYENQSAREELSSIMEQIPDVERLTGRIFNFTLSARDAVSIKKAVSFLPRLKLLLSRDDFFAHAPEIASRLARIEGLTVLRDLIQKAVKDEPPAKLSDGGTIKEGYNEELDGLRNLKKNSQRVIIDMELAERGKTGIQSLKIGYNSNFGYFIEVTKTHLAKVPYYYQRKQTLTNVERFTTPQLKELEEEMLGAEEKILKLENRIFNDIKNEISGKSPEIREFAACVAELDAFYSLAETAFSSNYSRPLVVNENVIEIEEGRHPVAEKYLLSGSFVPNDFRIGEKDPQIIILTGPNMSGKSVYLRQNALMVIMAQMGGFVPARSAKIGIVDRIMTRIGAQDRLSKGESTFMVEMKETSSILKMATEKSLVLLDEVGRGTSTFDGISIAWAVVEHLYKFGLGPKVLFATHYFELTQIAQELEGVKNFSVSVKEWTNSKGKTEVVFLHKIVSGTADKSYGIHVAELAGLPQSCIKRAKEILSELESKGVTKAGSPNVKEQELLPIFSGHPVLDEIRQLDAESVTPLEALNILSKLKEKI
ncbi:MAG: DNA mismatch repair protein MutS [Elusimicrobia bacterium CG08_land_8_20_14_0_20_51_18]|nr:MAG: DNA mismatch repair protein MutS [Elusimicrobia bacterium CG08_land_8_20_14_0_20_51_18]